MYTNIAEVQNIQNLWITSANLKLHHLSIGGIAYFAKTPHALETSLSVCRLDSAWHKPVHGSTQRVPVGVFSQFIDI